MQLNKESFEEAQRRVTGSPPSLSDRLKALIKNRNIAGVIIPALFISAVPVLVLQDILEEQELPLYFFVLAGALMFIAAFFLILFQKTSRASKRSGDQ
jgi:hypothetical protein